MYGYRNVILNFILKYMFIMNAASDGWRISYIGGNRFEFCNNICNESKISNGFINQYLKYKYINNYG